MQSCGVRRPCLSVNILRKSLLPDKWVDRDQTCTPWSPDGLASRTCSRSRSRSKVTSYGHLLFYENRLSSQANGWITIKLAHDGPQPVLHPRCAQCQGRGQRSRDRDTFVISRKLFLLARKLLDRHQTCTQWSLD